MTVTATLDKAASETVTVTISVAPANYNPTDFATEDDYVVSDNKVLTFAPGSLESTGTVTVTGVDDGGVTRFTRRIRVTYTPSTNALAEPGGRTSGFFEFLIADDDPHPTKSAVLSATEISENGGVAKVTAKLSHPTLLGDVLFDLQLGFYPAGTPGAAAQSDVVISDNIRLTVPAGDTLSTGTVTVTAVDNDVVGPARRRLAVRLRQAAGSAHTEPSLYSPWSFLTIREDDPGLAIAPTSLTVAEGGSNTYTVHLATEPTGTVVVAISAPAGADLTLDKRTLDFTTSTWKDPQTVTVTAGEDPDTADDMATLTHHAFGANYAGLSADLAVMVTDDDTAGLVLSPTSLEVDEGGDASYTVKLATEPTDTVTVAVTGQSGTDLTLDETSLTFTTSTWNDAQPVTVTAGEDTDTADDTATLTHTASGGGYDAVEQDLSVTVTDNDGPGLVFSPTSLDVDEGDDESYTVKLATEPTDTVTVAITGQSGTDLTLDETSLTFSTLTWNDAQPVTVTAGEDPDTADDTATLTHTASGGGYDAVEKDLAVTVTDNDQLPVVSFASPSSSAGEAAGTRNVTVNLSPAPTAATMVSYTVGGSATAGSDFSIAGSGTLSVSSGATTASIPVAITDDTADESNETVLLTLTAGSGYTVGSANSHTLTIVDDDGPPPQTPTVSLSATPNPHVPEGHPVTVTATLSETMSSSMVIPLVLTAGTAEAGDYGPLESITIVGGQISGSGTVTTTDDADRDDETFTVALGSLPPEVRAGSPSSVEVTIRDDDGTTEPPEPPGPPGPANRPPTVRVSCDPNSTAPSGEVRLTATASDPDGDRLTYRWSATAGGFDGPTDRASARWTAPAETGRMTISVRVSDGEDSVSATCTVEVASRAPAFGQSVYRFELPENLDGRRRPVDLGQVTAEDPDGDALTYDVVSGDRTRFGMRGAVVRYVGPGEDFETGPNRYELTVRARDAFGVEAQARVVVTVTNVNERPAAADDATETTEDEAVTVDVLANDSDPDGGRLRVESVSPPAHGTTRIAAGGGVLYTPEANYHGADRFTYVITDPEGETASAAVEVTVLSVNDAPVAVGAIPDQVLDEGGGSVDVDLTPFFEDADGDALRYRAAVSDTDVATVTVAGALLTLTPVVYGSAAVTVTAGDPAGLTATQTFTVGVDDRLVRAVVGDTLAAMARSHLASARMTLRRRMEAGGSGESRLTVMGRAVPLGTAAARQAAERMVMGWLSGGAHSGSYAHGRGGSPFGTAGAAPGLEGSAFGGLGLGDPMTVGMPPGSTGGLQGFGGFGDGPDALLRGTEFELALGGGEGSPGRRWGVWGQGDIQTFRGAPTVHGYDARYDGEMQTGYVGVDARLTERWLAGMAVSRSFGHGDWRVGASRGRMRTRLTALQPYVQWSSGTTSVWALAGGGWGAGGSAEGEAAQVREATGRAGTSGLGLRLGLVEFRQRVGGSGFGLRADAAWAELRTGEGRESVDGLAAAVNQQRVGAELSPRVRLGALALQPFGEMHVRRDGGAGQTGTGVEVALGLGLTGGIVQLDVQARTLAVHSAARYRERGAGLTLTVGGQRREGLSLSVSPRWGDAAGGTGALWQEQVYRRYLPDATQDAWALDARGGYGMRLRGGGLLTWFGSYNQSHYGRRFLVGGSLGGLADAPDW